MSYNNQQETTPAKKHKCQFCAFTSDKPFNVRRHIGRKHPEMNNTNVQSYGLPMEIENTGVVYQQNYQPQWMNEWTRWSCSFMHEWMNEWTRPSSSFIHSLWMIILMNEQDGLVHSFIHSFMNVMFQDMTWHIMLYIYVLCFMFHDMTWHNMFYVSWHDMTCHDITLWEYNDMWESGGV